MPEPRAPEAITDETRRLSYRLLLLAALVVYIVVSVLAWPQGRWHPTLGVALTALLLLVSLDTRVSLQRLDQLLGLAGDLGAAISVWSISQDSGPLSAGATLTLTTFFVVWFGVKSRRDAVIRAALLYAAILIIGLIRAPTDIGPLLYLGFLASLIGHMTYAGRPIRQELSEAARYADLALTDVLTGLQNRRAMYAQLQEAYGAPRPRMSVLLADIDHFKNINDNYGHDTGDQVLQHVAGVLRSCVRPGDLVSRWGGEEFLVMVQTDDREAMELIGKRILYTLRTLHSGLPPVTLSIGLAMADEATDVNRLLRLADRRLYRAKRNGRNQLNMDALNAHTTMLDGKAVKTRPTSR